MNEDKILNPLPKGWRWVRLGEMAKVKGGKRLPKNEQYTEGKTLFPYLRVVDFDNLSINQNHLKYLSKETHDKIKNYTISSNDLYISIAGTIGKVGTIPESLSGANLTENAAKITEIKEFDLKYLSWHLNSNLVQRQISEKTIATTQPKLALYRIEKLNLILPPKNIQQAIVSKIEELFSELDKGIENLRIAQQQLKTYRQAALKWAFEGKLTNENVKNGELPNEWKLSELGKYIQDISSGKSYRCDERPPKDDEVGIVKVSSVTWGVFDELESKTCFSKDLLNQKYLIKKGDFLFSRANTIEFIGACVIVDKIDRILMLSDKILRFIFSKDVSKKFVLYFLRSRKGRKQIEALSTGNQDSMRNIGQEKIRKIQFPYCPINEQLSIVQAIESRLSVADKIEESITQSLRQAEILRQSILKKAFEGKLV